MAGERVLPGAGLTAYWGLRDNTWKPGMDANLRLVSVLLSGSVASKTAPVPGVGSLGEIRIVPDNSPTNANDLAVWDGEPGSEEWVYISPRAGWGFYVEDQSVFARWDGAVWSSAVQVVSQDTISDSTYNTQDQDFASGSVMKRVNSASGCLVTVQPGHTSKQPLTLIQSGAGQISFVAGSGVTINSADGGLLTRTQFSSVTLVPDVDDLDTYYLIGDLTT